MNRPEIVCLCGSTRFVTDYGSENRRLTLAGCIVLSCGSFDRNYSKDVKAKLDQLHMRKIDLADSVHVINSGGYVGESTQREIDYARNQGKVVTFMVPIAVESPAAPAISKRAFYHVSNTDVTL